MTKVKPAAPSAGHSRFLDAADAIGRKIVRDAHWAGDRCTWLVWSKEHLDGSLWSSLGAAPINLYLGVAGIGLFLARLAAFTGDREQVAARDGAVRQVLARLAEPAPAEPPAGFPGYYTGALGAAHAVVTIGEIAGDAAWVADGLRHAEALSGAQPGRYDVDLLAGAAGAIPALLDLGRRHGRPALTDAAAAHGDALLALAVRDGDTVSWASNFGETRNLLGLSHGTAGVALALLELDRVHPGRGYREAGLGALAWERRHFDPAHGNWPDFRSFGNPNAPPGYPVAWCHGATGVGLSRLPLLNRLPGDAQLTAEIDAAAATVMRSLSLTTASADFSPCHGVAGNAEFLLMAGERRRRPELGAAAEHAGLTGLAWFHDPQMPWPCGVPDAGETPSLMTGTAGIGLFYLRLHSPATVPSMLLPPLAA